MNLYTSQLILMLTLLATLIASPIQALTRDQIQIEGTVGDLQQLIVDEDGAGQLDLTDPILSQSIGSIRIVSNLAKGFKLILKSSNAFYLVLPSKDRLYYKLSMVSNTGILLDHVNRDNSDEVVILFPETRLSDLVYRFKITTNRGGSVVTKVGEGYTDTIYINLVPI